MTSNCCYACVSTHHLFDHKPDNLLKMGHKHQLAGFFKFGTPGIAVAWGDQSSVEDFLDTLKRAMPQKKFELVFCQPWNSDKAIPTGWTEVQPPTLKEGLQKLGVDEEIYYTILGMESKKSESSTTGASNGKSKGGKSLSKGGKGKGKR